MVFLLFYTWCKYDTYMRTTSRRNLIILEENSRFISYWTIFAFLDHGLLITPMIYKSPTLSPFGIFCIHNLISFFFIDIFHGIIIPMKMIIPWGPDRQQTATKGETLERERRACVLEPRRYFECRPLEKMCPPPPPTSPIPKTQK